MTIATFRCDLCGQTIATAELVLAGTPHSDALASDSSAGTIVWDFLGRNCERVSSEEYPAVQAALMEGSPRSLYQVNRLWVPFYCPACDRCYCLDHWDVEAVFDSDFAGWYDCSYGTCPQGHRRMIDD